MNERPNGEFGHDADALKFGDPLEPFVPTEEQIERELLSLICPAGEWYVGDDAVKGSDHGHTRCLMVGWAIKRLRQNKADAGHARTLLAQGKPAEAFDLLRRPAEHGYFDGTVTEQP